MLDNKPPPPAPSDLPPRPLGETMTVLVLAWLIPGLGQILQRDSRRGLLLFVITQITFGLGLLFHGAVLWPVYSPSDWGLNAMSILTFVVQLANGLAALLCLGVSSLFPTWAERIRADTLFELGSMYLLVAGAINSFTVGIVYDRYLRRGRPVQFGRL